MRVHAQVQYRSDSEIQRSGGLQIMRALPCPAATAPLVDCASTCSHRDRLRVTIHRLGSRVRVRFGVVLQHRHPAAVAAVPSRVRVRVWALGFIALFLLLRFRLTWLALRVAGLR